MNNNEEIHERNQAFHEAEAAEKKAAEAKAEAKQEAAATDASAKQSVNDWVNDHPCATTAIVLGVPAALAALVGFMLGRMSK